MANVDLQYRVKWRLQVIMADDAAEPGPSDAHNAQLAASAAAAAAAEIPQVCLAHISCVKFHACLSQLLALQSLPDKLQRWSADVQATARLAGEHGITHAAAVQGGGTSVRAAAAAAAGLQAEDSAAPASRIQANPFLKGPAPTFVPRAGNPSTGAGKASAGRQQGWRRKQRERTAEAGEKRCRVGETAARRPFQPRAYMIPMRSRHGGEIWSDLGVRCSPAQEGERKSAVCPGMHLSVPHIWG